MISTQRMKRIFILTQNFTPGWTIRWPKRIAFVESPKIDRLLLGAFYHPGHLDFIRYMSINSVPGISREKLGFG